MATHDDARLARIRRLFSRIAGTHEKRKDEVLSNDAFRRVLDTTDTEQPVAMSIPTGVDIGWETHDSSQDITVFQGIALVEVEGDTYVLRPGDEHTIPADKPHNVTSVGAEGEDLKLLSIYSPPEHKPGTVHETKEDADAGEGFEPEAQVDSAEGQEVPTVGWHVSPSRNDEEIRDDGLWAQAPGTSWRGDIGEGVYVWDSLDAAYWFVENQGIYPVSVWKVDLTGLPLRRDPETVDMTWHDEEWEGEGGGWIVDGDVEPERLTRYDPPESAGFAYPRQEFEPEAQQAPSSLLSRIEPLRPQLAAAAQAVYDPWDQSDEDSGDPELGFGGLCQDIADALSGVLNDAGIDAYTQHAEIGDQHVWAVAYDPATREAVYVDIPPSVYETGSGYVWSKIPDVVFEPDHIVLEPLDYEDIDPEDELHVEGQQHSTLPYPTDHRNDERQLGYDLGQALVNFDEQGYWTETVAEVVPTTDIVHQEPRSMQRLHDAMSRIEAEQPLDPIELIETDYGLEIEDGVHRYNAVRALGIPEIPAYVKRRRRDVPPVGDDERAQATHETEAWRAFRGIQADLLGAFLNPFGDVTATPEGWRLDVGLWNENTDEDSKIVVDVMPDGEQRYVHMQYGSPRGQVANRNGTVPTDQVTDVVREFVQTVIQQARQH